MSSEFNAGKVQYHKYLGIENIYALIANNMRMCK